MKLDLFNLDLHVSVIADVRDVFQQFGHAVTDWTLSGHAWVFGRTRDPVEIVNQHTWRDLDPAMCEAFRRRYREELEQYDGFVVTHTPCFALLYRGLGKPILIVNSTRYDAPFTFDVERLSWLHESLHSGVQEGEVHIVSNNKADQCYLREQTGMDSIWVPSLCRYTGASYRPERDRFLVMARGLDELDLPPSLRHRMIPPERAFQHPAGGSRPFTWSELYGFRGIVHIPYQISTMALFEQYTANVPLFFPTKELLLELHKAHPRHVLSELSMYQVSDVDYDGPGLNRTSDPDVVQRWIDLADYYDLDGMPHIQYFESFDHLAHLLDTTNVEDVSRRMRAHNGNREVETMQRWEEVLGAMSRSPSTS